MFSNHESEGEEGEVVLNGETARVDTESVESDARLDTPPLLAWKNSDRTKLDFIPHKPYHSVMTGSCISFSDDMIGGQESERGQTDKFSGQYYCQGG